MKKAVVLFIFLFLACMFLAYAGIFRDNTNPLNVTRYYFDCLKNNEYFLTYPTMSPEYFSANKYNAAYICDKYKIYLADKVILRLSGIKGSRAFVKVEIIYKGKGPVNSTVELEKLNRNWLICDITYH